MAADTEKMVGQLSKLSSLMMNSVRSLERMERHQEQQLAALLSISDFIKDETKKKDKTTKEKKDEKDEGVSKSAAGQFKELADSVKIMGDSLPNLAIGLFKFIPAPTKKFVDFLTNVVKALTLDGTLKNPGAVADMYNAFANALGTMGTSIGAISKGLMFFPEGKSIQFITFVQNLFSKENMKNLDVKKAEASAIALGIFGKSMFTFIALSALALPLAIPAALTVLAMWGISKILALTIDSLNVSLKYKAVQQTITTLGMIGPAMFTFVALSALMLPLAPFAALGILAFWGLSQMMFLISAGLKAMDGFDMVKPIKDMSQSLIMMAVGLIFMKFVEPKDILTAAAVMSLMLVASLILSIMGKLGTPPAEIGRTMMMMSIALIAMGISMIIFKVVNAEDILKAAAVMGLLLIAAAGLTVIKKIGETPVNIGITLVAFAAAMIVMGIAMLLFKIVGWEDIGKAGAAMGVLILGVVGLGLAKKTGMDPKEGAIILILLSVSLVLMGVSVMMFKQVSWSDIGKAGAVIGGISAIAIGLGAGPVALMAGVGTAILLGLSIVLIIFSKAMLNFSEALKIFKGLNWKTEDSISLSGAIFAPIAGLFGGGISATGNPIDDMKSVMKNMGNVDFGAIKNGAKILGILGSAMQEFSKGLASFKPIGWNVADTESLAGAIGGIIQASVGALKQDGGGGAFGFIKEMVKTAAAGERGFMGAHLLREIGLALIPFSKGLKIFKDSGFKAEDTVSLTDAISKFILGLKTTFEGMSFKDIAKIKYGANAMMDVGHMMYSVANGVFMMASLKFKNAEGQMVQLNKTHFTDAAANLTAIFDAIKDPLIKIGSTVVVEKGFFSDKATPALAMGIQAMMGLGNLLTGIAKGLKEFAVLKDAKSLAENAGTAISTIYKTLSKAFENIGKETTTSYESKWGETKITTAPTVAVGMQAMSGIAEFIMGIAKALKEFQSIKDVETASQKVGASIVKIMENFQAGFKNVAATPDTMNDFISGYKDFFDITKDFAKLTDPLEKVATSFEKIGASIAGIKTSINDIDLVKMSKSKDFLDSIIEIDKIDLNDFQDKMKSVKESIEAASKANVERLDQLSKVQEGGDAQLKQTMEQIAQLLQANNSTMSMLVGIMSGTLKVDVIGDSMGKY